MKQGASDLVQVLQLVVALAGAAPASWLEGCSWLWALTALTPQYALCTSGMPQVCDLPIVRRPLSYSGSLRMKPVHFRSGV